VKVITYIDNELLNQEISTCHQVYINRTLSKIEIEAIQTEYKEDWDYVRVQNIGPNQSRVILLVSKLPPVENYHDVIRASMGKGSDITYHTLVLGKK
tara:strand:- start:953 stop:1243 length:291 start_codon:yes stop_codon:yes gene_type:complete